MATQRKAPIATPTVSLDNRDYVTDLLVSADEFVGKVRASALAVLKDRIAFTITEAAKFQPLYEVVVKEHRAVNGSDAKLSASVFAGRLTERGKVYRDQSDYVFPIPEKLFATILTTGYMVSRGLAKSGSPEPRDED